jgi:hypothetical protein
LPLICRALDEETDVVLWLARPLIALTGAHGRAEKRKEAFMELEFCKDFPEVRKRWASFWDGDLARPLLQIEVPRPGRTPVPKPYPVRPDRDEQPCIDQVLAWAETHEFLGDTVPSYTVEFAAAHFALLLGAELEYHDTYDETGWVKPFVTEWDDAELRFQREGYYWKRTVEILQAFRERCDGKIIVSAPVLSAGLDALSAVRGTQQLLMDLIERPDDVVRAQEQVCQAYSEIVKELSIILGWDMLGTTNWLGLYHSGWMNMLQCDFCTMISPEMFRRFELPFLQALSCSYDDFGYHLDGPEEIRHLEAICSLVGLKAMEYSRNRCIFGVTDVTSRDEATRLVDFFSSNQLTTNQLT